MANPDVRDLEKYCTTDKQRCYVAMVKSGYTIAAAAKEIGISERNFSAMLSRLRKIRDAAEIGAPIPGEAEKFLLAGQQVRGISAHLKDEDGNGFWFKTERDKQELEDELEEIRKGFAETLPREKPVKMLKRVRDADLLNCFILTDYHFGALSWQEETGASWDLKIAEDTVYKWFAAAVRSAPKAHTAVLGQIGDLLHYDGLDSITERARNVLDSDTRYPKMVRVVIRALRRVVRELLKHHEHVHIIHAEGNHDPAGSVWLREMSAAFYADEPRITVDTTPHPYMAYQWGKTALFWHHGHLSKPQAIDKVFAGRFPELYGQTVHRYAHMGHFHHRVKVVDKESNLMIVEQHETLAAPSSYDARMGFNSGRSSPVITYHKEYGDIGRQCIGPHML